jgi:hypothetical protein
MHSLIGSVFYEASNFFFKFWNRTALRKSMKLIFTLMWRTVILTDTEQNLNDKIIRRLVKCVNLTHFVHAR